MTAEKRLFKYSILYLFLLFGALVADRWVSLIMNQDPIHDRQRARAKVMALVLGALAILFFFITIAKLNVGHP